jgi:hypothetical protein
MNAVAEVTIKEICEGHLHPMKYYARAENAFEIKLEDFAQMKPSERKRFFRNCPRIELLIGIMRSITDNFGRTFMEERMRHFIQTTEELRMFEMFYLNITPKARKVFYYELKAMEQWLFEVMVARNLRVPEMSTWEKLRQTWKRYFGCIESVFSINKYEYMKLATNEEILMNRNEIVL